jgi:hypothetical protein
MNDDHHEGDDGTPGKGGRDIGMWVWAIVFVLFIIMTVYITIVPNI